MAEIVPFRGILYRPSPAGSADGDVSSLIAPPYDVISEREHKELSAKSPHNSVHLILPKDRSGGDSDERYTVAAATLQSFLASGVMQRDAEPALYRYHQIFTPPGEAQAPLVVRRGFICRVRLHRFAEGVILPHERTLAGPKADRLKLKRATRTHLSQVFGLYDDPGREADAAFAALEGGAPALHGRTSDGVEHRLWKLTDPAQVAAVQHVLRDRRIYIADGHHRYETMLALREELRRDPGYRGCDSAIEYGSIFLCNAADPGLLVFPTHRVLHSLPSFSLEALLAKLGDRFQVEALPEPPASGAQVRRELQQRGQSGPSFLVVTEGRAVYLTLRPDADLTAIAGPPVLRTLDVTLLHTLVFEQALGIDRAAQEAQTYLRYVKDNDQALQAAHTPGVQAVFLMNPTPVAQVMACSDAGEVMPQKATYFYPKIASGLVLNPLDPAEPAVPPGAA